MQFMIELLFFYSLFSYFPFIFPSSSLSPFYLPIFSFLICPYFLILIVSLTWLFHCFLFLLLSYFLSQSFPAFPFSFLLLSLFPFYILSFFQSSLFLIFRSFLSRCMHLFRVASTFSQLELLITIVEFSYNSITPCCCGRRTFKLVRYFLSVIVIHYHHTETSSPCLITRYRFWGILSTNLKPNYWGHSTQMRDAVKQTHNDGLSVFCKWCCWNSWVRQWM
jgi:hypothetical protein